MGGNNDPCRGASGGQEHFRTIVQRTGGAGFGVRRLLIGWQGEAGLDRRQIEERVVPAPQHKVESEPNQIPTMAPSPYRPSRWTIP